MFTLYLVKRATKLSSHNWPMEMREPNLRPSKMGPVFARVDSVLTRDNGCLVCLNIFAIGNLKGWSCVG
jgi:hypothetical protein